MNRFIFGRFMKTVEKVSPVTGLVTWVIATDGKKVSVYTKSPNCKISPFKPNCQCGVNHMNPEHIAEYLDAALVTGKFNRLVLVGTKEDIKTLKSHLDPVLQNRVEAEVLRDTIDTTMLNKELEKAL